MSGCTATPAHEKLTDSADWREYIDLVNHRYMTEDMELGLALLVSCATIMGWTHPYPAACWPSVRR